MIQAIVFFPLIGALIAGLLGRIIGHRTSEYITTGLLLAGAVLIVLGVFVDQVSMMLITLPIFMPIVQQLGIDPVWFGIMFLICMQLGLLLPPHGLLLMTMRGVAPPEVTMIHIFQAVVPYLCFSLAVLALVFVLPGTATWLPGLLK